MCLNWWILCLPCSLWAQFPINSCPIIQLDNLWSIEYFYDFLNWIFTIIWKVFNFQVGLVLIYKLMESVRTKFYLLKQIENQILMWITKTINDEKILIFSKKISHVLPSQYIQWYRQLERISDRWNCQWNEHMRGKNR